MRITVDVRFEDGGTVEVDGVTPCSYPDTNSFEAGAIVSLEAIPEPGYYFTGWMGDITGSDNSVAIEMDSEKAITANFSRITYALTIEVNGSGSITPSDSRQGYESGTVVEITAVPDSGWQFDGWNGDVDDQTLATTTVTMGSEKTITANFSRNTLAWWIIAAIAGGATIAIVLPLRARSRRRND
jgi:uncharacterized repeat protein (TIGR02543 family)